MTNTLHQPVSSDSRLTQVLEEYLAAMQNGAAPDRAELLARHPDLADDLQECLVSLEFINQAAAQALPSEALDADLPADAPERALGDFRIIREVGRGGMGVVYEAEQISLHRRVALKVLPFAATMDPRHLQRFKNEALAAASLEHPHIVPVYGVGCERGVHFYAMKFIDGRPLTEIIRSPADPPKSAAPSADTAPAVQAATVPMPRDPARFRQIAEWGIQAAEALEHAHSFGIVHRDVKPGNLMIDGHGKLWVTDFGLAKLASPGGHAGGVDMTMTGDLLGTLRYMSPEQALAKHGVVDHRTDVYALGATLYELLTGKPAVPGDDKQEVLRRIAFEEPIAPRKLDKSIPTEMETIALKCLAKESVERYATAKEVANDLRQWFEDKPIRAKPPRLRERAAKWGRRHPALVAAYMLLVLTLLSGTAAAAAFCLWQVAESALRGEQQARAGEARAASQLASLAAAHQVKLAYRAIQENDFGLARKLLEACPTEYRPWEWRCVHRLCESDSFGIPATATSLSFSPDCRQLLRIDGPKLTATASVLDSATGRRMFVLKRDAEFITCAAYSPDGRYVACGYGIWDKKIPWYTGGGITFWDGKTGQCTSPIIRLEQPVSRIVIGPDGRRIASFGVMSNHPADPMSMGSTSMTIHDVTTGQTESVISDINGYVMDMAFCPDGRTLTWVATSYGDGLLRRMGITNGLKEGQIQVKTWDVTSGKESAAYLLEPSGQNPLVLSRDTKYLAGLNGKQVTVWDLNVRVVKLSLQNLAGPVAFSADSQFLLTGSMDRRLRIWKLADGSEVRQLAKNTTGVSVAAISPDGSFLATGSPEGVRIRDLTAIEEPRDLVVRGYGWYVHENMAFTPDGRRLLSAFGGQIPVGSAPTLRSFPAGIRTYDLVSGREQVCALPEQTQHVMSCAFSPDRKLLVSGGADGTLAIWDTATGKRRVKITAHADMIGSVAFTPDGRRVVSGSDDTAIFVWDVEAGERIQAHVGHAAAIRQVAVDPDGSRIASASADRSIKLWDLATGMELGDLKGHDGVVNCLAFSPDGRHLASGSDDRTIKIWNVATHREVATLLGHSSGVKSVTFSPDGQRLVSLGTSVKLWNWVAQQEVLNLITDSPSAMAFSHDSQRLALMYIGRITIWDASPSPGRRKPGATSSNQQALAQAASPNEDESKPIGPTPTIRPQN